MADLAHALSEAPLFDAAFCETFAELVAWRRDVRHFRPGEAPDEATLAELFDLAALAPSVGNCQPTRFVRVDEEARRAAIRSNFEARQPRRARRLRRRAGGAVREAQARRPQGRADPDCGLLRRGDRAGPWPRRAHHAGGAPLFDGLRAAHVLARRPRARPWRRLGLDPGSRDNRRVAGRAARVDLHRLSLCGLSARGSSDPGARARGLAKPRATSGSAPIGSRSRLDLIRLWADGGRRPTRPFPGSLRRSADRD